ncbi:hypothetical protein VL20_753 [Microcystis panniformis FACHB-1757]|uniref:Uncharacterized protein n=1 Tax=Microcystis panniformis FACHB-1757 TaxID=1638788 RepID=A0A0K1RVX6_9CHRO|nr:hypothetical protein VL20_753 [Microcystis panniformis FACHB-1757]
MNQLSVIRCEFLADSLNRGSVFSFYLFSLLPISPSPHFLITLKKFAMI